MFNSQEELDIFQLEVLYQTDKEELKRRLRKVESSKLIISIVSSYGENKLPDHLYDMIYNIYHERARK